MKTKSLQILQYFILLAAGVALLWLFFKDFDFVELKQLMSTGNFSWFYLVMLTSIGVYVLRVLRWQMLIKAIGKEASFGNAFSALSIGYFVNFFVPRLGELTRCLSVKKQHDIPLLQLLGTVIIERVIDIVSLIIVLFFTLILQFDKIIEFVNKNIFVPFYNEVIFKIISGNGKIIIVAFSILIVSVFLFFYFRKYIQKKSPKLLLKFIQGLKEGLASVAKLQQKKLFVIYTFLIWVGYFLMTYFWFFVFKETSVLTWGACLTILSIGTIGRSVPIQGGGMGAYHFLVGQVVLLYGVVGIAGKTLATLIHAGQTFFTFAMGLVGLIIFFLGYWRASNTKTNPN